jgi:hypothetical protein
MHSATAHWHQACAEDRRRVSTVEQHVHSQLEVSPPAAALLLTALHWIQAAALAGRGRPDFALPLKRRDPLSARTIGLLTAVAVFGFALYAEEFCRCWRAHPTFGPCFRAATLPPPRDPGVVPADSEARPARAGLAGIRGRVLAPDVAAGCRIAMGVTMALMLVLVI